MQHTDTFTLIFAAMFAILDTETTGGQVGEEKIIDLAIFLHDGEKVVDQLITLINPQRSIQRYVQKMTGITENAVRRAPRFHEVAKRIIEITDGAVLVGHNIAFDYRMIRQEFESLGYDFECETIDSLFLAEGLIPGLPAYGLSKLCAELNIVNQETHRAEGDARATMELFEILIQKDEDKNLFGIRSMYTGKEGEARGQKLRHLLRKVITQHGVYYVFDKNGTCIYMCPLHQAKENITRIFLSDKPEDTLFQRMAAESESEKHATKWFANWKIHTDFKRLTPKFNNAPPIPKQRFDLITEGNRYRKQKDADSPLISTSSSFAAGKLVKLLNGLLEKGDTPSDGHLRFALIGSDFLLEMRPGRDVGENLYFVWQDYRLVGYLYSTTRESLKKRDALLKRCIPLSDDAYGMGIWVEHSNHVNLFNRETD